MYHFYVTTSINCYSVCKQSYVNGNILKICTYLSILMLFIQHCHFFMSSQTDVIVNAASKYYWKNGEVCRAILRKAGQGMEGDLEKASFRDLVIVTKAYNLSCKEVYHIVCPESHDDNSAQVEYDLNY